MKQTINMVTHTHSNVSETGFFSPVWMAPRFCTASPAEVDRPSLHPGGTCLFGER